MEEKILYENITKFNKLMIINGFKIYLKKYKITRILRIIGIFLTSIYNVKFFIEKDYFQILLWLPYLLFFVFIHKVNYFIAKKRQKYTLNLKRIYKFYNDRLEIITEISKLTITYDKIKFAFENSEAFYMVFEYRLICIDKNGFNISNNINFDYFIKNKVNFK